MMHSAATQMADYVKGVKHNNAVDMLAPLHVLLRGSFLPAPRVMVM